MDGDRLWDEANPPGVVQAGDVVRVIPRELLGSDDFFPRIPDGLPNAWDSEEPEYSAGYEKRAELIGRYDRPRFLADNRMGGK